jgi:hypothetical protein
VKLTVTLPIERNGLSTELSFTRDDDGKVEAFVPPANRTSSAVFAVDRFELLAAAQALCNGPSTFGGPPTMNVQGQLELIPSIREVIGDGS